MEKGDRKKVKPGRNSPKPRGIRRRRIKIVINEGRQLLKEPGLSLLQALKEENIFLPSACGGRGMCGLCRVRILEGAPADFTPAELTHLDAGEQKNNIRLACQIMLYQAGTTRERALRISVPEYFFNTRQYTAIVSEMKDLTGNIKEVRLGLSNPRNISFKSGQYIQLCIPPYGENKKTTYRAYSIASPPSENTAVELEIRRVHRGVGTTYIFDHLKKGDRIAFHGPHGDFYLRDSDKPIVMIAGGSGMAPMKSMLADMRERKTHRQVRYFFGARTPADIFYADLMRSFEQQLPDFRFIPSVSTVPPGKKWEGETGLITEVIARHIENEFEGEVYLCGSPAMIEACLKVLQEKKVAGKNIFYDKFA
jgi:Na+-transporting NADH:ubiquinone oxidoreductase subunit F